MPQWTALPIIFCMFALCACQDIPKYGLEYYVQLAGEMFLTFFEADSDDGTVTFGKAVVNERGYICQTLPIKYHRPAYQTVLESFSNLRNSSTEEVVGVWSHTANCYVSVTLPSVRAYAKGTFVPQCLPFQFAIDPNDCGGSELFLLSVASAQFRLVSSLREFSITFETLLTNMKFVVKLYETIYETNRQIAHSSSSTDLELFTSKKAILTSDLEDLIQNERLMLENVWNMLDSHFAPLVEKEIPNLYHIWNDEGLWAQSGRDSFQETNESLHVWYSAFRQLKVDIEDPSNDTLPVNATQKFLSNFELYVVSIFNRMLYFGEIDSTNIDLLQAEMAMLTKVFVAHHITLVMDANVRYRTALYQQFISSNSFDWDAGSYILAEEGLLSAIEAIQFFFSYVFDPTPQSDCILRKLSEFGRISFLKENGSIPDIVAQRGQMSGTASLFSGLDDCRRDRDKNLLIYFNFEGLNSTLDVRSVNAPQRDRLYSQTAAVSLRRANPNEKVFAANNTVMSFAPPAIVSPKRHTRSFTASSSPLSISLVFPIFEPPLLSRHEGDDAEMYLVELSEMRRNGNQIVYEFPSYSRGRREKRQNLLDCGPGNYTSGSGQCTVCETGSYSPGDSIKYLCYNAPYENAMYVGIGMTSADCDFVCTNSSFYRSGNFCIAIPIGFYSPDGSETLLQCDTPFGPQFSEFLSAGTHTASSCQQKLCYLSVLLDPSATPWSPSNSTSLFYLSDSFTVEMWMRWGGSSNMSAQSRFSLIELPGVWSFDVVLSPQRGVRLQYRVTGSAIAESDRIDVLIDGNFHYVGIIGSSGIVLFYCDGISIGLDYTSPPSTSTPQTGPLAIAGVLADTAYDTVDSSAPMWFTGDLDEIRVYGSAVAEADLGYFASQSEFEFSCDGVLLGTQCFPECPAGLTRLLLSPSQQTTDPLVFGSLTAVSSFCDCPPDQEWYGDRCVYSCPSNLIRSAEFECLCPAGTFAVWDASGTPYLFLSFFNFASSPTAPFALSELQLFSDTLSPIEITDCTIIAPSNSSTLACNNVINDLLTDSWIAPSIGDLTIRLRLTTSASVDTIRISSILIRLPEVESSSFTNPERVTVYLSNSSNEYVEEMQISDSLLERGVNVLDDRRDTSSVSRLLTCTSCIGRATHSEDPRASLKDCQCDTLYVRNETECVLAAPSRTKPSLSPCTGTFPEFTEIRIGASPRGYSAVSLEVVLVTKFSIDKVILTENSLPIVLEENTTLIATAKEVGRFDSESVSCQYTILPRAQPPVFLPDPLTTPTQNRSATLIVKLLTNETSAKTQILVTSADQISDDFSNAARYDPARGIILSRSMTLTAVTVCDGKYQSLPTKATYKFQETKAISRKLTWLWVLFALLGVVLLALLLFYIAHRHKLLSIDPFLEKTKRLLRIVTDCLCCVSEEEEEDDEGDATMSHHDASIRHLLRENQPAIQVNPSYTISFTTGGMQAPNPFNTPQKEVPLPHRGLRTLREKREERRSAVEHVEGPEPLSLRSLRTKRGQHD